MTYEPTQKGNPHLLTVKQHTFPKTSIARFAEENGNVEVFLKAADKVIRVKPSNQLFCAERAWDQQAESGFMKRVEDDFQALAGRILDGDHSPFQAADLNVINEFYCLWNIREIHKHDRVKDQSIASQDLLGLSHAYTKDDHEYLESEGICSIRADYTVAGRFLAGANIRLDLVRAAKAMGNSHWNILLADEGEFIAPDNARHMPMIPLSPTTCLWYGPSKPLQPVEMLNVREVAQINQLAIEVSKDYYYARELSLCPCVMPDDLSAFREALKDAGVL